MEPGLGPVGPGGRTVARARRREEGYPSRRPLGHHGFHSAWRHRANAAPTSTRKFSMYRSQRDFRGPRHRGQAPATRRDRANPGALETYDSTRKGANECDGWQRKNAGNPSSQLQMRHCFAHAFGTARHGAGLRRGCVGSADEAAIQRRRRRTTPANPPRASTGFPAETRAGLWYDLAPARARRLRPGPSTIPTRGRPR